MANPTLPRSVTSGIKPGVVRIFLATTDSVRSWDFELSALVGDPGTFSIIAIAQKDGKVQPPGILHLKVDDPDQTFTPPTKRVER